MNMESRDEELINLIARCAIRDQAALKQLFDRLSPYLNMVAFRILKSEELSNDALQEAFVQIWNNAASYRPDLAKPLTWITSIVRYRALDSLEKENKHNRWRTAPLEQDDDLTAPLDSGPTPEQEAQRDQVHSMLENCMKALGDNSRQSIMLAYLEGYSRDEIAARFKTNINTVKSWLHRGAERLRQCLEAKINASI
jgi:RNA polymerase sigma-70 factor (ECF subfamily)